MTKHKFFSMVTIIIMSFLFLFPLVVIFSNSFMPDSELNIYYNTNIDIFEYHEGIKHHAMQIKFLPKHFTLSNYITNFFYNPTFLNMFANSLKILIPILIFNTIISILTAYGFHFWSWRYKYYIFNIYILIMLLPVQAVILPNFIIAQKLGLLNTHLSIILPNIFSPFGAFLLLQSLRAVPPDYFEAGQLEGANDMEVLIYLVVPQLKSAITSLIILTFIENWNLVEQVFILIKDFSKEPLSIFLSRISDYSKATLLSASCIYMVLPIWIVIYFQKNLEQGIELSGIK